MLDIKAIANLKQISEIGKSFATDLLHIGINSIADLIGINQKIFPQFLCSI